MNASSDAEVADTLAHEVTVTTLRAHGAVTAGAQPVVGWDRYELFELLGEGGMGAVYRARDRRLGRILAIKFIAGTEPNLAIRFLGEARAQARIDHPNVCKVYEVGEIDGRSYIALQFVDGELLDEAAQRMTLDEKVAAVRDVALAIHEAHRLGIVHRDVKPGNVLVEHSEDGGWFPIVMDFGLAREATVRIGITESGIPLGTPAYMSPEQARGDVRVVDRRSDVYSLGATLYELLTGSVPFPASSLAVALARVLHDEPAAPRSLIPGLPVDLDTIALKCLAKDPAHRYPSARALADDLDRYLRGEAILGRRLSLCTRARLWIRRHRALVTLAGCALAALLVVAGLGLREVQRTGARTGLAQRLGREAVEMSNLLRLAHHQPLHDTRPDREAVRARMHAIAATRHDLGALGDAIVHEALGRGHLALHEWREAADELGRAATGGLQTPDLHAALGRALGELYHSALDEARGARDPAWLARRQEELAHQYLEPALAELAHSRGASDDAAVLEALIALYRRDFAAAEQRARSVAERTPGSAEARTIAADAAYAAAVEALDTGHTEEARVGLERASALYAEASEIARSDASLYDAAAKAWLQRAEVDVRQKRSPRESLERALALLDDGAVRADPDDVQAYVTKAAVLLRWYATPSLAGQDDKRRLLERIAEAAARAVQIDPQDPRARTSLARAYISRGRYEMGSGGQGEPWLARALEELDWALILHPGDVLANSAAGAAHRWLGTGLESAGRDPVPEYRAALDSYARAAAIDPKYLVVCANQVDLQTTIAEYQVTTGRDPRAAIEAALQMGQRCLAIDHRSEMLLDNLAQAYLAQSQYLVRSGGDSTTALANARHYLDLAADAAIETMVVWFHRLVAANIEATFLLQRGADPTWAIDTGRAALKETLRLRPKSARPYVEAARLDLAEAAWTSNPLAGRIAALTSALTNAEKAISLDAHLASAKLVGAEACLRMAAAQRSHALAERGISYVAQALQRNPQLHEAVALRDALQRLRMP